MLIETVDKANGKATILEAAYDSDGGRYDFTSHFDKYEKNGTIRRTDLQAKVTGYFNRINSADPIERVCLIRIITDGENYINANNEKDTYTGITMSAKSRLEYPSIDIGKISTITSNSIVEEQNILAEYNDLITYQITVRNKSSKKYTTPITVVEDIDSFLIIEDSGGGTFENNQLKWTINSLGAGEAKRILYTVKVPYDESLKGQIIVSTGMVENIANSRIETLIGNKLSVKNKQKLLASYNKLKNSTSKERAFINNVYKDAFGVDIGLNGMNNLEIISFDESITKSMKDALVVKYTNVNDSDVSKYIYNNFYGLRISEETNSDESLVNALEQWNFYPNLELNDRARTLKASMLDDGDIILVYTGKTGTTDVKLVNKAYIFLQNKLIRKTSSTRFEEISGSALDKFLRNIVCDNYIILRPSLELGEALEPQKNFDVNGVYYESLAEAYNAITDVNGVIKLARDCTDSSDVTIAKGKNIIINTNENVLTKTVNGILNYGTLTIEGEGAIRTLDDGNNEIKNLISNHGTLNVNDVTLENAGLNTSNWYTIYSPVGVTNINAGIIKSFLASGKQSTYMTSAINTKDTLNVYGGKIESTMYGIMSYNSKIDINIIGGEIEAKDNAIYVYGTKATGKVSILKEIPMSTEKEPIMIKNNKCILEIK